MVYMRSEEETVVTVGKHDNHIRINIRYDQEVVRKWSN
jgi:predicted fused transcriptional regulator/phosphomethylpyrimidine kinase